MLEEQPALRVDVLGPLRLTVGGLEVDVPGPKRRAVLALLALAEGRIVAIADLVDSLWPDAAPDSGRQALHSHVFRLRGHLGAAGDRLETGPDGYRLELDSLDLTQARSQLREARALVPADPTSAVELLEAIGSLWRGPVLADLQEVEPLATASAGCEQLRRDVRDSLVDAAIRAGRAAEVIELSRAALAEDPLREPAVLLLMRALAGAGRPPEALAVAREFRELLAEETGLDPSPALDSLVQAVASGTEAPVAPRASRPTAPQDAVLSAALPSILGRDGDIAALHRALGAERLVTVAGPGGVGKTRLATEVARQSGSVTVLRLASVTEAGGIALALAEALGLDGVQDDVLTACAGVLDEQMSLLVVDNCEHLLAEVGGVIESLLGSCPRLRVVTTSREPLGVALEYTYRLHPLALPGPGQDPASSAAVNLLIERASRVRPDAVFSPEDLESAAEVVRRLDGIPLAIELAAGRLSTFTLADLAARIDRSLDLFENRSGNARHRTLRAAVEWSYSLLSSDEQELFRYLAIFADGCDLPTAERIADELGLKADAGSLLARLVDASMIGADLGAIARYQMLETLRAFGRDRLEAAGETERAEALLSAWAVALAESFRQLVATADEPQADATLRRELANLRGAWASMRRGERIDDAAVLVASLFDAVAYRDLVELRAWAEELAEDAALDGHPLRAAVLGVAGESAYHRGDHRQATSYAEAGLALAQDEQARWICLSTLSVLALARQEFDTVVQLSLEAAELATAPRENLGIAGLASAYAGDLDRANELNERGGRAASSPTMLGWTAYVRAEILTASGDRAAAGPYYAEAIDLARTSGARFIEGVATVGLQGTLAEAGQLGDALRGYRDVIEYFARTGNWSHLGETLRNLATLVSSLDDDASAQLLREAAGDGRRGLEIARRLLEDRIGSAA